MEPLLAAERAAALDLLGGGPEDSFVAAAATLAGQGDHALALEIISPGLLRYPASAVLQDYADACCASPSISKIRSGS